MGSETNARFDTMGSETNARFDTMNARFDALTLNMSMRFERQTRWLVGMMFGWLAVMASIWLKP
jgi:hypothetical protein